MLAECSGVGIEIDMAALHPPAGIAPERWLRSFPSFGFLLSVAPADTEAVCARVTARGIDCSAIGRVTPGSAVTLTHGDQTALFWDPADHPYLNLGGSHA